VSKLKNQFAASVNPLHTLNFKKTVLEVGEGDTTDPKELAPVRLIKNKFYQNCKILFKVSYARRN
jgi:enoyl-[acyl-carrier protein] reductase II